MRHGPRLVRQIPTNGQAHRAARNEALTDFARSLVEAGVIVETFQEGALVLELVESGNAPSHPLVRESEDWRKLIAD